MSTMLNVLDVFSVGVFICALLIFTCFTKIEYYFSSLNASGYIVVCVICEHVGGGEHLKF